MAGTAGKYEKLHDSSRDEDGSRPTAGTCIQSRSRDRRNTYNTPKDAGKKHY